MPPLTYTSLVPSAVMHPRSTAGVGGGTTPGFSQILNSRPSIIQPWFFFFFFFFPFFPCAPPLSPAFSGFRPRVPWASALCVVCFVGLPPLGSPCACPSFVLSAWLVVAPRWLLPPPPLFLSRGFVAAARCCVPCAVLCCARRLSSIYLSSLHSCLGLGLGLGIFLGSHNT